MAPDATVTSAVRLFSQPTARRQNPELLGSLRRLYDPRSDLADEFLAPARTLSKPLTETDEIHFAFIFGSVMKRAEAGVGFRHHVQREPGAITFAVLVPVHKLVLAETLNRLYQAVGHGIEEFGAHLLDGLVEQGKIDGALGQQRLAVLASLSCLPFTEHQTSVLVQNAVCHDQGICRPPAVDLQGGNDLSEPAQPVETVGAPSLAEGSAIHGTLDPYIDGKKISSAAVRSRAVFGSGLTEKSEITCDREIARHPDFLAAAHADAIHAANHWFVALQNGRNHIVENAHVLTVFSRCTGVVLCVFACVSTAAEGTSPRP